MKYHAYGRIVADDVDSFVDCMPADGNYNMYVCIGHADNTDDYPSLLEPLGDRRFVGRNDAESCWYDAWTRETGDDVIREIIAEANGVSPDEIELTYPGEPKPAV